MRISVITPNYPTHEEPYSGAPIWATLTALSRLAGVQVHCSLPRSPALVRRFIRPKSYLRYATEVDPSRGAFPATPLPYFSIPGLTRQWNGDLLARSLEERIEAEQPDVIISYWVYPEGYAALKASRNRIPVVISSRGSDLKRLPPEGPVLEKSRQAVRGASALICVSDELRQIALAMGARSETAFTVLNGIDPAIFRPLDRAQVRQRLGLAGPEKVLLFVGHLIPLKGVLQIAEAVQILSARGETWSAAFIGEGHLKPALEQAAARMNAGRLLVLGAKRGTEVADWMNAADVLCLASETEGCPNVVIEAQSCGCPVVATVVGAVPQITGPDSAILVADNRPSVLAEAIHRAGSVEWNRAGIAQLHSRSWESVAHETLNVCRAATERMREGMEEKVHGRL